MDAACMIHPAHQSEKTAIYSLTHPHGWCAGPPGVIPCRAAPGVGCTALHVVLVGEQRSTLRPRSTPRSEWDEDEAVKRKYGLHDEPWFKKGEVPGFDDGLHSRGMVLSCHSMSVEKRAPQASSGTVASDAVSHIAMHGMLLAVQSDSQTSRRGPLPPSPLNPPCRHARSGGDAGLHHVWRRQRQPGLE